MFVTLPSSSLDAYRLLILRTALTARQVGISVVPITFDGSKRPCCPWAIYQHRLASLRELTAWFHHEQRGLAFVTGAISGGLEAIDFDTYESYLAWSERLQQKGLTALHERLKQGYLEASPRGMHLLYRCQTIERNQKLAKVPVEGPQHWQTLIETRGEGGLIVVAPSSGGVHPSGKPYVLLQGAISTITTITPCERQALFTIARTFDSAPPLPPRTSLPQPFPNSNRGGKRPGDLYNQRVCWEAVLVPHGWKLLFMRDGQGYWQRPGKEGPGISATTNYRGCDLFYVFSTSTVFEAGRSYSKFGAYTLLEHGGDFAAAARTLAAQGYTQQE